MLSGLNANQRTNEAGAFPRQIEKGGKSERSHCKQRMQNVCFPTFSFPFSFNCCLFQRQEEEEGRGSAPINQFIFQLFRFLQKPDQTNEGARDAVQISEWCVSTLEPSLLRLLHEQEMYCQQAGVREHRQTFHNAHILTGLSPNSFKNALTCSLYFINLGIICTFWFIYSCY